LKNGKSLTANANAGVVAEGEATAKFTKKGAEVKLGGDVGTKAEANIKLGDKNNNIGVGVSAGNVAAGVDLHSRKIKDGIVIGGSAKLAAGVGA